MARKKRQSLIAQGAAAKQPVISYNTGTFVDVANGRFVVGKDKKQYLDGGYHSITSYSGKTQTFKSVLMWSTVCSIMGAYPDAELIAWENENSVADNNRFKTLARNSSITDDRIMFFGNSDIKYIEEFEERLKDIVADRIKYRDDYLMETPFKGLDGKPIMQMAPLLVGIDSFSAAQSRAVDKEHGKKPLDDAKGKKEFMDEGHVKTRFFKRLPIIAAQAGLTFFSTSHLGKKNNMGANPMADKFDTPITPNMKKDDVVKGGGSQYMFLSNNFVEPRRVKPMTDGPTDPIYPVAGVGRSDLLRVTCCLTKGKSHQGSGFDIPHICSGIYGIEPALEAYDYLKEKHSAVCGKSGNKVDPLTQTKFTRNNLRSKLIEDAKLERGLTIMGHYAFIRDIWIDYRNPLPTVIEFAEALNKAPAAMRDAIINSTGIWEFTDAEVQSGKEYMSIFDILNTLKDEGLFKS